MDVTHERSPTRPGGLALQQAVLVALLALVALLLLVSFHEGVADGFARAAAHVGAVAATVPR